MPDRLKISEEGIRNPTQRFWGKKVFTSYLDLLKAQNKERFWHSTFEEIRKEKKSLLFHESVLKTYYQTAMKIPVLETADNRKQKYRDYESVRHAVAANFHNPVRQ